MFSEVWGLGLFRSLLVSPSWFYQCSRLPEATAAAFNSLGAKWRIAPCAGIVWKNDLHNMTLLDLPYLYSYSYRAGLDKTFDSRIIGDTLKHSQVVDVYTYLQWKDLRNSNCCIARTRPWSLETPNCRLNQTHVSTESSLSACEWGTDHSPKKSVKKNAGHLSCIQSI